MRVGLDCRRRPLRGGLVAMVYRWTSMETGISGREEEAGRCIGLFLPAREDAGEVEEELILTIEMKGSPAYPAEARR